MMCHTLVFIYLKSFNSHNTAMMSLQKKKPRYKELKEFVLIHTTSMWQNQDSAPESHTPVSMTLIPLNKIQLTIFSPPLKKRSKWKGWSLVWRAHYLPAHYRGWPLNPFSRVSGKHTRDKSTWGIKDSTGYFLNGICVMKSWVYISNSLYKTFGTGRYRKWRVLRVLPL